MYEQAKEAESVAVKDINIYIAGILGKKYRHRIDIGKGDIDPPLIIIADTAAAAAATQCALRMI